MTSHQKINQKIKDQSRKQSLRILCIVGPVLIMFSLVSTITSKMSEFDHSIKSNVKLIEQSIALGDLFIVRQFLNAFASDPAVLFCGLRDREKGAWKISSDIENISTRSEFSTVYLHGHGIVIPQVVPIGNNSASYLYFEYIFYYSQIIWPILVSIFIALVIYNLQQNQLTKTSSLIAGPVERLAEDVKKMSDSVSGYLQFSAYNPADSFLEIDMLAKVLERQLEVIRIQNHKMTRMEILEALRKYSRQVAHDINSPLGAIKAARDSFKRNPDASVELITKALNRIENIVADLKKEQLSEFSDQLFKEFNIVKCVESALEEKNAEFGKTGLNLTFSCECHEASVYGDVSQLSRALSNILNNSIEASPPNAPIIVNLGTDQQNVHLAIIDSGKGISVKDIPRLGSYGFTKGKTTGQGTGLWQAQLVVHSMGGKLEIKSAVGQGTQVIITIPKMQIS